MAAASRKRKDDAELAEGLELEGFVQAGTPAAYEELGPAAFSAPHCIRCGSPISYVFLTSKGPMGGDCLATLTGDQSTRRLARLLAKAIDVEQGYREITGLKISKSLSSRDYKVEAVSTDRNRYNEWTGLFGTRTHYLISFEPKQLPVVEAMVAHEAEARGLTLESDLPKENPGKKPKYGVEGIRRSLMDTYDDGSSGFGAPGQYELYGDVQERACDVAWTAGYEGLDGDYAQVRALAEADGFLPELEEAFEAGRKAGSGESNPSDDRAVWTGWSCPAGPAELVEFLVSRGTSVSYSTFRKNVDVKTADFLERWQRGLLPTDYSVTFLKTDLPDGTRCWVMQHSGIEYAFVAPGVDFYQAVEDVERITPELEEMYGWPNQWPREAIDAALAKLEPVENPSLEPLEVQVGAALVERLRSDGFENVDAQVTFDDRVVVTFLGWRQESWSPDLEPWELRVGVNVKPGGKVGYSLAGRPAGSSSWGGPGHLHDETNLGPMHPAEVAEHLVQRLEETHGVVP
jgi:hypothetical protein